ncbi:hypothetical protein SNK04_014268 [Fusarium graminearum]
MGRDFRFWVEGGYLWSQAEGGQPVQELPLPGATRISACYDQNGRLHVVYNTAASCFFRWYDSQAGGMVTTEYAGVLDAQCILDDPRQYWSASSDVLLIYTLAGALNVREQRPIRRGQGQPTSSRAEGDRRRDERRQPPAGGVHPCGVVQRAERCSALRRPAWSRDQISPTP